MNEGISPAAGLPGARLRAKVTVFLIVGVLLGSWLTFAYRNFKARKAAHVLIIDEQGVTMREIGDTPYLTMHGVVENVGFFSRSRNVIGSFLVDVARLLAYFIPSLFASEEGQKALDERDLRMLVLKINLKEDRFGTRFELNSAATPPNKDRIAAATDAFLVPARLVVVGGVLGWVGSYLSTAEWRG
jgi:hypothetical protein